MQRARKASDKLERRRAILNAADDLLRPDEYELPSAAAIAAKANLAKGTLYLYFKTKEEIYLVLLAEGYKHWAEHVAEGLTGEWPKLGPFLKHYIAFCADHPKTMTLACLGPAVLEPNVNKDAAIAYKKGIEESTREIGELLSVGFPPLSGEQARQLYPAMHLLTIGHWHQTHPPHAIQPLVERGELKSPQLTFEDNLYAVLEALWQGYRGKR